MTGRIAVFRVAALVGRGSAMMRPAVWLSLALLITVSTQASADDTTRRQALRAYAVKTFKASTNHCRAFADIAGYAAQGSIDAATWFEDMRLVIVGEDWRRRASRRGVLFMGSITNDSGFKSELRDGSPQVEHAFGAIFLGKALPPASSAVAGSFAELATGGSPDSSVAAADHKLYLYGTDIGSRISNANLKEVPGVIRRVLCE